MNEKIKEVLSDEAFVKTLLETEDAEAVQKLLADKGVDMSLEEIKAMGALLAKAASGEVTQEQLDAMQNGELDDDALEEVAGGFWAEVKAIGIIAAGVVAAVGLGGLCLYAECYRCGVGQDRRW